MRPLARLSLTAIPVLAATCALYAQSPTTAPATAPAGAPSTRPSTRRASPEAAAKAKPLIEKMMTRLRSAKSYADRAEFTFDLLAKDKEGKEIKENEVQTLALAWAGPNRLALTADDFAIHANGSKLWLYSAMLEQYTEEPAPDRVDLDRARAQVFGIGPPHPIAFVLSSPDKTFEQLFPMIVGFSAVEPETRDGRPGVRIEAVIDTRDIEVFGPFALQLPLHIWLDEATHLPGSVKIDATDALQKQITVPEGIPEEALPPDFPRSVTHAVITVAFRDQKYDVEIPGERFIFKPGPDARKVDKIAPAEEPEDRPEPTDLIGQAAPDFEGQDLDDKPVKLADFKGRVLVLDFWATWCGPCLRALPLIQKVHEQYADKPVTVLGMNTDRAGVRDKVRTTVADKKLTFRQFLDADGKVGRKYNISGIPCVIVLDKQGVVQAVHLGYSQKLAEELSAQIDKLLKGENLFDPDQVRKAAEERAKRAAARKDERPPVEE